jgi:hypothetical protein
VLTHLPQTLSSLNHASEQLVDVLLTIAKVTTLRKVVGLLGPATIGMVELEWPQEVGGLLEVWANGVDLVDEVLNANNTVLAQRLLDDGVIGETNALLVHFAEAALVDELAHRLEVRVAVGDVGLGNAEHVDGGLVELDKGAVVDLSQAEELEHLADLRVNASNTSNTDDKSEIWLSWHVEVALGASHTLQADDVLLLLLVLAHVLLGTLEDLATLGLEALLLQDELTGTVGSGLGILLALLEQSLWHFRQSCCLFCFWHLCVLFLLSI